MTAVQERVVPDRSLQQRLDALKRANAIRSYRADLKKALAARRVDVVTVLTQTPECLIASMKLIDLLLAVPKLGHVKASQVLTQCRISPSKTVDGLSQRQRDELVRLLRR